MVSYWELYREMLARDLSLKVKGSYLGRLWFLLNPLLMLIVYSLVFKEILKLRWPGESGEMDFALIIFLGITSYLFLAESIQRAVSIVRDNEVYVVKVKFPLELFPLVVVSTASVQFLFSMIIWGFFYLYSGGSIALANAGVFILVYISYLVMVVGLSYWAALLGLYVRDMSQIVGACLTFLLFLSPIFYSLDAAPEQIKSYLNANPLSFPVEAFRELLFYDRPIQALGLVKYLSVSLVVFTAGLVVFNKLKNGFSDEL